MHATSLLRLPTLRAACCHHTPAIPRYKLALGRTHVLSRRLMSGSTKQESGEVERRDDLHCTERVRTMDYEHYLCGLLFPRTVRKHYFAVRAFNIELAIIKDVISSTSSPNIGTMRLDFWRQVINSCYKTPPNPPAHPVARALSTAISECKLSRHWFKTIVDKRERDLVDIQPRTMAELQSYVEGTAGCLKYLALECLGIKDVKVDHAAIHLELKLTLYQTAVAEGLVTILRGTAYHSKNRKMYFPVDLTTKVWEVASTAKVHLDKSRSFRGSVPPHAIPALLSSVFVEDFLTRLERSGFDIFDPQLQTKNHWNIWRLLYNNYKRKY